MGPPSSVLWTSLTPAQLPRPPALPRLWDAAKGAPLATLSGHKSFVTGVCFSPDGATIASASEDDTVRLWDAATGRELAQLRGHGDSVTCVAFAPDGAAVASGSEDDAVRVWAVAGARGAAAPVDHDSDASALALGSSGTLLVRRGGSWARSDLATGAEQAWAGQPDAGSLRHVPLPRPYLFGGVPCDAECLCVFGPGIVVDTDPPERVALEAPASA